MLVQSSWELPIVIQWPQSKVSYEFTSTPGDISFGIVFVPAPDEPRDADDLEIETVEEIARVSSHNEIIGGEFEAPCEGVVFFLWDNNFDWSAVKKISYSINVIQVSCMYDVNAVSWLVILLVLARLDERMMIKSLKRTHT